MFSQQDIYADIHPFDESPRQRNSVDFSDTFSHDSLDYHSIYDKSMNDPHRRSENDIYPMLIAKTKEPQSLAMSAPAGFYDYYPIPKSSTSGTSNNSLARSFEEDYTAQLNMQMTMEKKRQRRESHNAVERRRRDLINEKIQELCDLLPEFALDSKPNKGIILKKSVEHIRQLQQEVQLSHQRIEYLENTLKMYQQH